MFFITLYPKPGVIKKKKAYRELDYALDDVNEKADFTAFCAKLFE